MYALYEYRICTTSIQVAPFCAFPNLAPRGCARVLVNKPLHHCLVNAWTPAPRSRHGDDDHGMYGSSCTMASSAKIVGVLVTLRPLWRDPRRYRNVLVEDTCDRFAARVFAGEA